jgi:MFS family permease
MSHFFRDGAGCYQQALFRGAIGLARDWSMCPVLGGAGWVKDIGTLSGAVIGFGMVRFLLGLGEAGNFPAAVKTTAEWFPKRGTFVCHGHLQLRDQHWAD